MSVNLATGYTRTTAEPVDVLYLTNTLTSYASISAANTAIVSSVRYIGQFVNINNQLYWYKNGITDGDLILFNQETTPLITKGDIYVRNTSDDTRLPVGLDTQVLMADSSTATGLKWASNTTPTPTGYYGAWQDDQTQTAAASNTGYAMIFRIIDLSNGVSVVTDGTNLTRITFANTGIYNLQFSSQFQNVGNTDADVTIWLRLMGTDVPGSSGFVQIPKRLSAGVGNEGHVIVSWNYLLSVVGGEYYELVWSTNDYINVTMQYYAASSPPPAAASVILTVMQQSGIMAGTGITAINSLTGAVQTLTTGTSGTDFGISSTGTTHTFNLPTASATNRGALSSADWTTFNNKQAALGYTPVNKAGDTMLGNLILNANPTAALQAATKDYVDTLINGIDWKAFVNAATVAALPSYNVTGSGTILTGTVNGAIPSVTTDGVTLTINQRVLVKNETSTLTPNNGIYVVTQVGSGSQPFILTRSSDANTSALLAEATVSVAAGSTLSNTQWHCNPATIPLVIGTTNITFAQIGSGVYTFSSPLVNTGGVISIPAASGSVNGYLSSGDYTNFTTAYIDRLKWDGGSTGLTASTGRTSLGATTVGSNLFTLTNPSAITFIRVNADNTVSTLDAATFRTAISAGTVTSVEGTGTVSGLTLTGTVTTSGNLTLGGTLSVTPSNFASQTANTFLAAPNGSSGIPTFRTIVAADIPTLNQNTTGSAGSVTNNFIIKADSGTTEGTDLYTFNGSVAKTLNILAGSNVTITKAAGSWTIAATQPTVNNGTLTLAVSGVGLSGSATFTANQSTGSTFTVTSNATSTNTVSTIVSRDASGNFSAGTITATSFVKSGGTSSELLAADGSVVTAGTGITISGGTINASVSGGTVTTVSVVSANGFAGTVATPSSTPAITLSTTITGLLKGNGTAISAASAGTDYQAPISLTVTGNSGPATFISNTLNIPTYTLTGLGGFTNPMTTLGDVIYGGASGVATRLSGNTTTTKKFLIQTGTGTVSAAPVWDTILASDIPGSALTKTDDTNVTLTLGGSASTALLNAASITVGWTGTLAVGRGGTGASTLTGVVIGNASSAMTAVSSVTANQLFRVNATGTGYEFFTPSYITSAITSLGGLTGATQTFADDTNVTMVSTGTTHTITWSGTLANSRLATMADNTIKGNVSGSTASPSDLTGTQVTTILDLFSTTTTTKGLVPGSNNVGATYYLDASGTWSIPAGGGGSYTFSTGLTNTSGTVTANLSVGVSGGQSVIGGSASGESLTLTSTSDATKGSIIFGSAGLSVYDEVNDRFGLGITTPTAALHIVKSSGQSIFINSTAPNVIALQVNGVTTVTSGTSPHAFIYLTSSPTSNSSASSRALNMRHNFDAVGINFTGSGPNGPVSSFFENRITNVGAITSITGAVFAGTIMSDTALTCGTITDTVGIRVYGVTSFSNTLTNTITNSRGLYVHQSTKTASQTITNQVGLNVEALTNATNNTAILLGTTTIPSGNFAIYSAGTETSYFAGNVQTTTIVGNSTASGTLTLSSTSNATKGKILFGTSGYDEVNNRLGIGTTSPTARLTVTNGSASQISLQVTSSDNANYAAFFSATNTNTASNVTACTYIEMKLQATATSAANNRALYMSVQINSTAAYTANPVAGWFECRVLQAGTISNLTGGIFYGAFVPAAGVTGSINITNTNGIQIIPVYSGQPGVTGTISNARGLQIQQSNIAASSVTITSQVGVIVEQMANATNNTHILIGTSSVPSGNFTIYSTVNTLSYLAGSLALGVISTSYKLDVNGSGRFASALTTTGRIQAWSRKTSAYTLINTDRIIAADANIAPLTITLPAHITGIEYTIYKYDSTANKVTISPTSGTISGNSTYDLTNQYNSITVVSDGTNWIIVSLIG